MKKILLIEDEEVLLRMYQEKFNRSGFDVVIARTSEEGIELVEKEKPDLIVLDIILPNKSGIHFLEKIRGEKKEFDNIPIIVFSNYDNPETASAAEKYKIEEYVIKANHDPQEIVEKITGYFSNKE
jgi:CheY-like chemotaxis protein